MQVEELAVAEEEAERQLLALKEMFKRDAKNKKVVIYADMRKVYGHLRHGKKVIDIYDAFKSTGVNDNGDPKLAICRADAGECYLRRYADGSGVFSWRGMPGFNHRHEEYLESEKDVKLPPSTFQWKFRGSATPPYGDYHLINREAKTLVPMIPAPILVEDVKRSLSSYHILWEVEEWKPIPPVDPILLKQLTPNLYGVLATWNLTKLEQAIIRGRIGLGR